MCFKRLLTTPFLSSVTLLAAVVLPTEVGATPLLGAKTSEQGALELQVVLSHDPVVIPMEHSTKHATVSVLIDGKGPFLFQVDTYSSGDGSVDDDLAKELGLIKTGTVLTGDGQSNTRTRDLVRVEELCLGGVTFRGLNLTVNDYEWVNRPDGKQVHGILGFAAFREFLLTFDYPGNRLIMGTGRVREDDDHVIPFSVEDTGSPDIQLKVGTQSFVFGVDTGYGGDLAMIHAVGADLGFREEPVMVGQMRTHFNSTDFYRAVLGSEFDLAGHPQWAVEIELLEGWSRNLIGYELLSSYEVSFDQRSGLMRLSLPPLPKVAVLSDAELEKWVGSYEYRGTRMSIERDGDALFFRVGKQPRLATIPLGPAKLRLESESAYLHLRTHWFRDSSLEIVDRSDRPSVDAKRVRDE